MSGGSWDYLCYEDNLGNRLGMLWDMSERLENEGGEHAARATRDVIRLLKAADAIALELREVWRAVEWNDSADTGPEHIQTELAKYGEYEPGKGRKSNVQ